jgi:hypothetical protein
MVKTMPGKITPDFNGRSGKVTFLLVIAIPFPVIESTWVTEGGHQADSFQPGLGEDPEGKPNRSSRRQAYRYFREFWQSRLVSANGAKMPENSVFGAIFVSATSDSAEGWPVSQRVI